MRQYSIISLGARGMMQPKKCKIPEKESDVRSSLITDFGHVRVIRSPLSLSYMYRLLMCVTWSNSICTVHVLLQLAMYEASSLRQQKSLRVLAQLLGK